MKPQFNPLELKKNAQNLMQSGDVSAYFKALLKLLEIQKNQRAAC